MIIPIHGGRAYGNFVQANHLADYLALGLVSAAYLHAAGRLRWQALVVVIAALAYGLALSASRSSWFYLGFLVAGAAFATRRLPPAARKRLLFGAVRAMGFFVILQFVAAAGLLASDPAAVTTAQRLTAQAAGGEERWTIWARAVRMFLEAPWIGAGFGRFPGRFFEIAPALAPPLPAAVTSHAHNLFLQVASELGLPGLLLLGAGLLLWWSGARRAKPSLEQAWLYGLLAVIGIHSLLEYPLWYAYFLGTAAIALGASGKARLEFGRARLVPLGAAVAPTLGWFACVTVMFDYHVLRDLQVFRRRAMLGEGTDVVTRHLLKLERRSMLSFLVELGFARAIEVERTRLADKLALNTLVMRVFPEADAAYRQS